jgi:hypothetical protein
MAANADAVISRFFIVSSAVTECPLWHKADIPTVVLNVRFRGKADIARIRGNPKRTLTRCLCPIVQLDYDRSSLEYPIREQVCDAALTMACKSVAMLKRK